MEGLTIGAGTGTVSAGGAIGGATPIGNLTLNGGTLSMGSHPLTLQGNWTNSAGATGFSAGSGTVSFVGGGTPTLASGGSSFQNLTISGGTAVTVQTNPLTVSGQLTISGNTDSINLQNLVFAIGTLSFGAAGNTGTFFLNGTQSGTSTISSYAATAGVIELEGTPNASFPGTLPTTFYDLTINGQTAGTTYTLNNNITVKETLTIGVLPTPLGIFDASASNYGITVGNTWQNNVGPTGFAARQGTATFSGGINTFTVAGSNSFYTFQCTTAGAAINFQALQNPNDPARRQLHLVGASANPIVLHSTIPGSATNRWFFDLLPGPPAATLTMAYVDVYDSDATANPISTPANVNVGTGNPSTNNDYDWYSQDAVTASKTTDLNGDGKIDAIVVTVQAAVNGNFSGFRASVSGYTVTGYAAPPTRGFLQTSSTSTSPRGDISIRTQPRRGTSSPTRRSSTARRAATSSP